MAESYQPLGRIDPSSLIGQAPPAVNPSAVEQLVDAFHKGFVSADDIHDRLAGATSAKRRVEIQAAGEALTPEAIAARKAQAAAAGAQAEEFISPEQVEARRTGAETATAKGKAEIKAVTYPYAVAYDALAAKARSEGAQFPEPGENLVQKNAIGYALTQWKAERDAAQNDLHTRYGVHPSADGTTLIPTKDKAPTSVADFQEAQRKAAKPFTFIPPGITTAPAAPFATPETPAPMIPAAPGAEPETPAPMVAPITKPMTAAKPEIGAETPAGFYLGEKPGQPKAFTEAQGKALLAQARDLATQPTFDKLEKSGFDPGSGPAWLRMEAYKGTLQGVPDLLGKLAVNYGPDFARIKPEERGYASAANLWIQGLLRVESGAAISVKEQKWYENALFPALGDTREVQRQKALARKTMTRSLEEVITGKQSPQEYEAFRESVGKVSSGGTAAAPAAAPPAATPPAPAPVSTLPIFKSADEAAAQMKTPGKFRVAGDEHIYTKHF